MHRLMFLLLLAMAVYGKTPDVYSGIGDPIYSAVEPVRILGTYKTFKDNRTLFASFVHQADSAKKEGLWLDRHRHQAGAKKRAKAHLRDLRELARANSRISKIVKDGMLGAIDRHHVKTYYAIKKSAHPVMKSDRELRRAMARFERRLAREHKRRQKEKARKDTAFLCSYDNLRGTWRGKSSSGSRVTYRFSGKKRLEIVERSTDQTQTLKGSWKIASNVLQVSLDEIINQKQNGVPHARSADIRLSFKILEIGTKKIALFDQRRKTEVKLAR
ncbi:MAG: hypothetical protein P8Y51_01380 [Campylobacterales bacterium]|jgi:hypothetical protein